MVSFSTIAWNRPALVDMDASPSWQTCSGGRRGHGEEVIGYWRSAP